MKSFMLPCVVIGPNTQLWARFWSFFRAKVEVFVGIVQTPACSQYDGDGTPPRRGDLFISEEPCLFAAHHALFPVADFFFLQQQLIYLHHGG
jgi:hypothetical protein